MENRITSIHQCIYFIRGQRVLLDSDLARMYGVATKVLNQSVRRNLDRFPEDFMFQLTSDEYQSLRSQFVTLEINGRGKYSKYLPFVFTEQGVSMLSSVLNSKTAVQVNIEIMRTFVRLRGALDANKELAKKVLELEQKYLMHDHQFKEVFEAIRLLMATGSPVTQKRIKGLSKS